MSLTPLDEPFKGRKVARRNIAAVSEWCGVHEPLPGVEELLLLVEWLQVQREVLTRVLSVLLLRFCVARRIRDGVETGSCPIQFNILYFCLFKL
jgi:hypothetical protein